VKDRDFPAFMPPTVSVNFTKMDLSGKIQKLQVEENISYETILVANIPKKNDKRPFPPDPTAPWLEMYAKTKNPGKRNILVTEPRQHVVSLSVSATDIGANFGVIIDGQLFRGLKKIKISRVFQVKGNKKSQIWNNLDGSATKDRPVVFPIETFFPLDM